MKKKWYKLWLLIICIFAFQFTTITVHATADSISKDGGIFKEEIPADDKLKELWETHQLDKSSLPFELQGVLSGKAEIAKQELKEEYIQLFYNTAKMIFINEKSAAKFLGIPIPFSENLDFSYHFTNVIGNMIEVLERLFSWFTIFAMMLYARASDNFFGMMVEQLFQFVNKDILQINQFNGVAVKLIIALAAVSLLSLVIQRTARGKGITPKALVYQVIGYILNVAFIFFILNYGPGIMNTAQTTVDDFLTQAVLNEKVPLEIVTKRELFDLLQKTPFYFRHFGVVEDKNSTTTKSKEELTAICYQNMEKSILANNENNADPKPLLELAKIKCSEQITKIKNDNNTLSIASFLKNPIESTLIMFQNTSLYAVPTKDNAAGKLSDALIFGFFRFILGGVILFLCAIYLFIGILYNATLYLSCYSLVFTIKNPDKQSLNWFLQRLSWMVFYSVIGFIFSVLILVLLKLSKILMTINFLFLFLFDGFLIFMLFMIIKNPSILINMLKKIWSTFVDGALHGKITPKDALVDVKDMVVNGANATFEKAFGSNKIDEVEQNINALETSGATNIRDDLKEVHASAHYSELGISATEAEAMKTMPISDGQQYTLRENPEELSSGDKRVHSRINDFIPKNQLEALETIAYLYGKTNTIPNVERTKPSATEVSKVNEENTELEKNEKVHIEKETAVQHTVEKEIHQEKITQETAVQKIATDTQQATVTLDIRKQLNLTDTLKQLNQTYTSQNWYENDKEQKLLQELIQVTREMHKTAPTQHVSIQHFVEQVKNKGINDAIIDKYLNKEQPLKDMTNESI